VRSIIPSEANPPLKSIYDPCILANAFSNSSTQSSLPFALLNIGPFLGWQGKKSSTVMIYHSPPLQNLTLYNPSSFFSFVMKRFSTSCGRSVKEAKAHISQQSPRLPYCISLGSIFSNKAKSPSKNSLGRLQCTADPILKSPAPLYIEVSSGGK